MTNTLTILSLGAGVQSSALALMAEHGEIPKPNAAIFADTQNEPASVYSWLDFLETQLSFPVYRVTAGNLGEDSCRIRKRRDGLGTWNPSNIPAYTVSENSKRGIMPRQCTHDFKIIPVRRQIRLLMKGSGVKKVICLVGISLDEAHRMKPSGLRYLEHQWPLVECGITRQNCIQWMADHGYPKPPRSACVFCPYHSDHEWLRLKTEEPDEFRKACEFEDAFRAAKKQTTKFKSYDLFLHHSRLPLRDVVFEPEKQDQLNFNFGNECEGMCGV